MSSSIGQNPTLFFLSATCDKILSWVVEIWMKNHLVSDSNCNTVKCIIPQTLYKEWQIMLGLTFSAGDTTPRSTISIEQDNQELVTLNIIFSVVSKPYEQWVQGEKEKCPFRSCCLPLVSRNFRGASHYGRRSRSHQFPPIILQETKSSQLLGPSH